MDPGFHLSPGDRSAAAQVIARLLAETALLGAKTRGLAWRLEGPAMTLADTTLAAQERDLWDALTPIARRLRSLGFRPPIGHAELVRAARGVADASGPSGALRHALLSLGRDHDAVSGAVRFARPMFFDLSDGASLALLDGRLAAHENAAEALSALCVRLDDEGRRLAEVLDEPIDFDPDIPRNKLS